MQVDKGSRKDPAQWRVKQVHDPALGANASPAVTQRRYVRRDVTTTPSPSNGPAAGGRKPGPATNKDAVLTFAFDGAGYTLLDAQLPRGVRPYTRALPHAVGPKLVGPKPVEGMQLDEEAWTAEDWRDPPVRRLLAFVQANKRSNYPRAFSNMLSARGLLAADAPVPYTTWQGRLSKLLKVFEERHGTATGACDTVLSEAGPDPFRPLHGAALEDPTRAPGGARNAGEPPPAPASKRQPKRKSTETVRKDEEVRPAGPGGNGTGRRFRKCGTCHTCLNPRLKKACLTPYRERLCIFPIDPAAAAAPLPQAPAANQPAEEVTYAMPAKPKAIRALPPLAPPLQARLASPVKPPRPAPKARSASSPATPAKKRRGRPPKPRPAVDAPVFEVPLVAPLDGPRQRERFASWRDELRRCTAQLREIPAGTNNKIVVARGLFLLHYIAHGYNLEVNSAAKLKEVCEGGLQAELKRLRDHPWFGERIDLMIEDDEKGIWRWVLSA